MLLSLLLSVFAYAADPILCDYRIMGAPFSKIELAFTEDGAPEDFVTVSVQGRGHRESFTPAPAAEGEFIHGWISQESAENSLEMIVYREEKPAGRSKLINRRMPIGKEIWGSCSLWLIP